MSKITIARTCPFCGKTNLIEVEKSDWEKYNNSSIPVQRCFPYLSADEREMIISGTCPECWERDMNFGETDITKFDELLDLASKSYHAAIERDNHADIVSYETLLSSTKETLEKALEFITKSLETLKQYS